LVTALTYEDWVVRGVVADALAKIDNPPPVQQLINALTDFERERKAEALVGAVEALRQMRSKASPALPALARMLAHDRLKEVRVRASQAIAEICGDRSHMGTSPDSLNESARILRETPPYDKPHESLIETARKSIEAAQRDLRDQNKSQESIEAMTRVGDVPEVVIQWAASHAWATAALLLIVGWLLLRTVIPWAMPIIRSSRDRLAKQAQIKSLNESWLDGDRTGSKPPGGPTTGATRDVVPDESATPQYHQAGGRMTNDATSTRLGASPNVTSSTRDSIVGKEPMNPQAAMIGTPARTILFLGTNPKASKRLRLDEEVKKIEQGLERSKRRDQFKIIQKWAVTGDDLRRAMLDYEPEIVHFAGHCTGAGKGDSGRDMVPARREDQGGLAFEDDTGQVQQIPGEFLARLFELCADHVKCVVLNACSSEEQADAIARHIDYVVGMRTDIEDEVAIQFAVGFYDALGAGKDYEKAFKFGCSAIGLDGLPEYLTPVLKKKPLSGQRLGSRSNVLKSEASS
jgi:hypothetical protein